MWHERWKTNNGDIPGLVSTGSNQKTGTLTSNERPTDSRNCCLHHIWCQTQRQVGQTRWSWEWPSRHGVLPPGTSEKGKHPEAAVPSQTTSCFSTGLCSLTGPCSMWWRWTPLYFYISQQWQSMPGWASRDYPKSCNVEYMTSWVAPDQYFHVIFALRCLH